MSQVRVVIVPNALRASEHQWANVTQGQTVAEIVGVAPDKLPALIVVDGEECPAERWHVVVPQSHVLITRVPQGGVGRLIGQIAVVAAAVALAPILLPAGASAALVAAGTAGLAMVGTLALNALIPPPVPSLGGAGSPEQLPAIAGQSNQVTPFAPIPRAYGKVTWYPPIPMTALPYTELQGQDQYLRMMLCLGYGPLEIGGVQVGGASDDPIRRTAPTATQVGGATIGTGTNAGQIFISGYGWITIPTIDASATGGTITSLTGEPIKIGGTDINEFDDVEFEIGRPDQITLYTQAVTEVAVNVSLPISADPGPPDAPITVTDGQQVVRTTEPDTDEVEIELFSPSFFAMGSGGKIRWTYVDFKIEYRPAGSGSYVTAHNQWRLGSAESKQIREGRRIVLPSKGQWDIRLTRVQTLVQRTDTIFTDFTWTVMRSISRGQRPFDVPGTVVMALRIRATDQLGGRIDRLSVETESVLPTWNGSAWVDAATRNPAWVYADIASGSATKNALAKSGIDGDALKDWADFCDTEELYFDGIINSEGTGFDRMREVAAAGFGSWSVEDDAKVSVVRDIPGQVSRSLIAPRTAFGFSAEKLYPRIPHAVRVQFVDADTLEVVERVVFDDGYNASNATRFEQLQTVGIRTPEHAWKIGRYHLAQLRLRSESFSWQQDIQHLVCRRGHTVEIAQDVILVGLKWGRIKALIESDGDVVGATVDESLLMEAATNYAVQIQRFDGSIVTVGITTVTPSTTTITFDDPVTGLEGGEAFLHGVAGQESILARVNRIEPMGDFLARVGAVPAAEDIFDAWDGEIPEFDPVITEPIDEALLPPPIPVIEETSSGLFANQPNSQGGFQLAIDVAFTMPPGLRGVVIEAQVRTHETVEGTELVSAWRFGGLALSTDGSVRIRALEEDGIYDIRLRSRRDDKVSSWTAQAQQSVLSPDILAPIDFVALPNPDGIRVRWTLPPDPSKYDLIRLYMSSMNDFDNAVIEYEGRANEIVIPLPALALRYFWISAVRRGEEGLRNPNESTTTVAAISQLATASEVVVKQPQAPLATEGRIWVDANTGDIYLATDNAKALTDEADDILTEEGGLALVDGEWVKITALDVLRLINAPEEAGANVTETRTSNNTDNVATEPALTVEEATQRAIAALEASGDVKAARVVSQSLALNAAHNVRSVFSSFEEHVANPQTVTAYTDIDIDVGSAADTVVLITLTFRANWTYTGADLLEDLLAVWFFGLHVNSSGTSFLTHEVYCSPAVDISGGEGVRGEQIALQWRIPGSSLSSGVNNFEVRGRGQNIARLNDAYFSFELFNVVISAVAYKRVDP